MLNKTQFDFYFSVIFAFVYKTFMLFVVVLDSLFVIVSKLFQFLFCCKRIYICMSGIYVRNALVY